MKRKLLIILGIVLLIGCQVKTPVDYFADFKALEVKLDKIAINRGYQGAKTVAKYTEFNYYIDDGQQAIFLELVDDEDFGFRLSFSLDFKTSLELPQSIEADFIIEIVNKVFAKNLTTSDLEDFFHNDDYNLKTDLPSEDWLVVKAKDQSANDDCVYYLEVSNDYRGYLEFSGLLAAEGPSFEDYCIKIEKVFKKYNYQDLQIKYAEGYLITIDDNSELVTILYSNNVKALAELHFNNDCTILYQGQLKTEKEKYQKIDIDLYLEIVELLSPEKLTGDLLWELFWGDLDLYEVDLNETANIEQKLYLAEDDSWLINYELSSSFLESLEFHDYGGN